MRRSGQITGARSSNLRGLHGAQEWPTIREIRGWGPATPLPHSPPEVIGVINLRDLAHKLGMRRSVHGYSSRYRH
ncbi:chemotaxis protein CheW [Pseudorhizobium tarimense]|uniref:chemotaxis protein CheW n=1 Tax=Pseudorhizobium tarimense TaxID=1079109 RepID=UPI0035E3BE88